MYTSDEREWRRGSQILHSSAPWQDKIEGAYIVRFHLNTRKHFLFVFYSFFFNGEVDQTLGRCSWPCTNCCGSPFFEQGGWIKRSQEVSSNLSDAVSILKNVIFYMFDRFLLSELFKKPDWYPHKFDFHSHLYKNTNSITCVKNFRIRFSIVTN